ncbi:MAG TPA: SPOR domain-containing protein, partial [Candidatus Kapabacteria bacterium]|nr:SPOR domain-containing protein [Candidatus Kapabacteria bacterium]
PVKPVAVKQTIDVAKLREQEIVPPHVPAAVAPELEVQREGLKWVRILVLSGVSIICAMVILAWFLASRNTTPVETKHVVQFSPAEPPSPTVQQPAPTVQQAQPSVKANDVTSKSSMHEGYAASDQNGFNETTVPDESVLTKRLIDPHYEIQALATPRRTEAEQMVSSLKARGADAFVSATVRNNIDFFRVRIGNYSTERDAKNEAKRLGLNAAWIEKIQ